MGLNWLGGDEERGGFWRKWERGNTSVCCKRWHKKMHLTWHEHTWAHMTKLMNETGNITGTVTLKNKRASYCWGIFFFSWGAGKPVSSDCILIGAVRDNPRLHTVQAQFTDVALSLNISSATEIIQWHCKIETLHRRGWKYLQLCCEFSSFSTSHVTSGIFLKGAEL